MALYVPSMIQNQTWEVIKIDSRNNKKAGSNKIIISLRS